MDRLHRVASRRPILNKLIRRDHNHIVFPHMSLNNSELIFAYRIRVSEMNETSHVLVHEEFDRFGKLQRCNTVP